jgi:hypothetical protein
MRLLALTTTHGASDLAPADLTVPDLTHVVVTVRPRTDGTRAGPRLEIRRRN